MKVSLVEADHVANQFWTLTHEVKHEVPAEALFAALPEEGCARDGDGRATHEHSCFMADLCTDDGDIVDGKEVSEATVVRLLDEPIEVARDRDRAYWGLLDEFVTEMFEESP